MIAIWSGLTMPIFLCYIAPGMNLQSRSANRLASLVEDHIEIITFEMSFARYLLEFLVRGISLGMVSYCRKSVIRFI